MKAFIASSSRSESEEDLKIAKDVANIVVEKGDGLLCGGISSGMMKAVYEVFHSLGRPVTCITLEVYQEDLKEVEESLLVETTFDRTKALYQQMDYAILLPGGSGSMAELFSMLEEARTTGAKKMFLYNENGFFDSVIALLKECIRAGKNDETILHYFQVVTSQEELKEVLKGEEI